MLKLYKRIDNILYYHEAWKDDSTVIEHFGVVGEQGEIREHCVSAGKSSRAMIKEILAPARALGYKPISDDDHEILIVEYPVNGFGTDADLDKRVELEDKLNDSLGWTGLGYCDGGSIGSGTMEAACFVVDFSIAKRVLEEELRGTEFADYTRIYLE